MVEEDFHNEISQVSGSRDKLKYLGIAVILVVAVVVIVTVTSGAKAENEKFGKNDADKSAYTLAYNSESLQPLGLGKLSHVDERVNIDPLKKAQHSTKNPSTTNNDNDISSFSPEEIKAIQSRLNSEMVVYYNDAGAKALINQSVEQRTSDSEDQPKLDAVKQSLQSVSRNSNDQFASSNFQAQVEVVQASQLKDLNYTILQGKHIHAILETPISSKLPGQIKAIVSDDVYGEKDKIVLIPKGSRVIGTYNSATELGQVRIYVIWTRIITPAHVNIMVNSGGADEMGLSGLSGKVNNHFFQRFSSAIMLSLIGGAAQTVGVNPQDQPNSAANLRSTMGTNINAVASQELNKTANITPTISLPQGAHVTVMVQRDLRFTNVKSAYSAESE